MTSARTRPAEPPPSLWLDRLLARRGTRHNTLGSTGARVFCPHLENGFGLRGRFCFVHDRSEDEALADPAQLTISVNGQALEGNRAACMWYPSHARRQVRERDLGVVEAKFITWDDVLCDVITLTNHSETPLTVKLDVRTAATADLARSGKDTIVGSRTLQAQRLFLVLAMRATRSAPIDRLICELRLKPGESTSLLLAMAVGTRQNESQKALGRWAACEDPLVEQQRQYQRWFDASCPRFDCPDEQLVRLWWYRWFLVRHNLVDARLGKLPQPVCYPGKSGPLARLSANDGVAILREVRWLRDPLLVHSQIAAHAQGQSPEGLYEDGWLCGPQAKRTFLPLIFDATLGLPLAFHEALCVHPQPALPPQLAPSMARYLAAVRKLRDGDNNFLLEDSELPVERVDSTAFFAASLRASADMLGALGKKVDAQWHEGLAERCRAALVGLMWCGWRGFFCDVAPGSNMSLEAADTRGLLPFALGLVPDEPQYAEALDVLVDEEHLWTAYPVAETSLEITNEPLVQPVLNALVADVMAEALRSRKQTAVDPARFMGFMRAYARLAFEEGDPYRPQSRERYSGLTGLGEGAVDVLTDHFNDLLIRHLVGLLPQGDDTLVVDPLATGWTHFRVDDAPCRGRLVTIIWESRPEGERYADAAPGLTVRVDGALAAQSTDLERITATLP